MACNFLLPPLPVVGTKRCQHHGVGVVAGVVVVVVAVVVVLFKLSWPEVAKWKTRPNQNVIVATVERLQVEIRHSTCRKMRWLWHKFIIGSNIEIVGIVVLRWKRTFGLFEWMMLRPLKRTKWPPDIVSGAIQTIKLWAQHPTRCHSTASYQELILCYIFFQVPTSPTVLLYMMFFMMFFVCCNMAGEKNTFWACANAIRWLEGGHVATWVSWPLKKMKKPIMENPLDEHIFWDPLQLVWHLCWLNKSVGYMKPCSKLGTKKPTDRLGPDVRYGWIICVELMVPDSTIFIAHGNGMICLQ